MNNKETEAAIYDNKNKESSLPNWGDQWDMDQMNFLEKNGDQIIIDGWASKYLVNKKVLVVGCGNSGDIEFVQKYTKNITGIDISPEEIRKAKERLNDNDIELLVMDAEELSFDKDSFDVIFCKSVLHHLPNLEKSFSEMNRILKDDGVLFISREPILWNPVAFLGRTFFPTNIHTPDEKPFIPYKFDRKVKKYFKKIEKKYFYLFTPAIPILSKMLKIKSNLPLKICYNVEKFFGFSFLRNFYWIFSAVYKKNEK